MRDIFSLVHLQTHKRGRIVYCGFQLKFHTLIASSSAINASTSTHMKAGNITIKTRPSKYFQMVAWIKCSF